jgi:chromosome segregation ATPase
MSRASVADLAKSAIDEAADQIRLVLSLEPRTASLLTDEIIAESDLLTKLDKFIHLVVDRLKFQPAASLRSLMLAVADIDPSAPTDARAFTRWIVKVLKTTATRTDHKRRDEVEILQQEKAQAETLLSEKTDQFRSVSSEKAELERRFVALDGENRRLLRDNETQQRNIQELKTELLTLRKRLVSRSEVSDEADRLRYEKADLGRQIDSLRAENRRSVRGRDTDQQTIQTLNAELDSLQQRLSSQTRMTGQLKQLETLRADLSEKTDQLRSYMSEKASLARRLEDDQRTIQELRAEVEAFQGLSSQGKTDLEALRADLSEKTEQLRSYVSEKAAMARRVEDGERTIQELRGEVEGLQRRLSSQKQTDRTESVLSEKAQRATLQRKVTHLTIRHETDRRAIQKLKAAVSRLQTRLAVRKVPRETEDLQKLRAMNAQLCARVDQLQSSLASKLPPRAPDSLDQVRQLQDAKDELSRRLRATEERLADAEREARRWKSDVEVLSQRESSMVARLSHNEQKLRRVDAPRTRPRRGCAVDVGRLRERFDSLEDVIDDLHATLVRSRK